MATEAGTNELCEIIIFEFTRDGDSEASSVLPMMREEVLAFTQQAYAAIRAQAGDAPDLRIVYTDDEGDDCTLNEVTLSDAVHFAVPSEDTGFPNAGKLKVRIIAPPKAAARDDMVMETAPEKAELAVSQAPAAEERGACEAAAEAAAAAPGRDEEEAASACQSRMAAAMARRHSDMEVHLHVVCDGCEKSPILGKRYKSLVKDDYDLCEACFEKQDPKDRNFQQWVRVKSDVFGSVVGAYYQPPQPSTTDPIHYNVVCDRCDVSPIVGKRFKCADLPDYDLCGECYEASKADPEWASRRFDEIVIAPAEGNASATNALVRQSEDALSTLSSDDMRAALESLLQHAREDVRSAAAAAVLERPAKRARLPEPEAPEPAQEPGAQEEPEPPARKLTEEDWDMAEPVAVESEKGDKEEEDQIAPEVEKKEPPVTVPSARVVSCAEPTMGIEVQEVPGMPRGDATAEFPGVGNQAFRMGCLVMKTTEESKMVPVCTKFVVVNNGEEFWPETTILQHLPQAGGEAFGFPGMQLGPIAPNEAAEVIMDLNVPARAEPGASRSVWALMDAATGKSLGPVVLLEVNWVA